MSPPEFILIMSIVGSSVALVFFFAVPLRRAWMRKIEGAAPPADPEVLGELDHLRARVGELEERLDFAERLLARQRSAGELQPGDLR